MKIFYKSPALRQNTAHKIGLLLSLVPASSTFSHTLRTKPQRIAIMTDKEIEEKYGRTHLAGSDGDDVDRGDIADNADQLQRRLGNRQIQLIAIGGSIGTALFVSIGGGLNKGGPGSLFLAYTIYSCIIAMVNNCMAEMATLMPVSGGFIRLAGKWVDDAFGKSQSCCLCSLELSTWSRFDTKQRRVHGWLELLLLRSFAHPVRNHRSEPCIIVLAG